jgi:hypothetical protein
VNREHSGRVITGSFEGVSAKRLGTRGLPRLGSFPRVAVPSWATSRTWAACARATREWSVSNGPRRGTEFPFSSELSIVFYNLVSELNFDN